MVNPSSYENIKDKWIPELRKNAPTTPFLIIGTQNDLRTETRHIPKSIYEGEKLAKQMGAVKYIECSAKTFKGRYALTIL